MDWIENLVQIMVLPVPPLTSRTYAFILPAKLNDCKQLRRFSLNFKEINATFINYEVGSHEPSNHDPSTLKLIQTTLHDYVFLTFIILKCMY